VTKDRNCAVRVAGHCACCPLLRVMSKLDQSGTFSGKVGPDVRNSSNSRLTLAVGAAHVSLEPAVVWTVLGSCVAVILYAPARRISAICHASLPLPAEQQATCNAHCPHPCRRRAAGTELKFVSCCIDFMRGGLSRIGISDSMLVASIVGGATQLQDTNVASSVGTRNVTTARELLKRHSIHVGHENVGGTGGRTVTYITDTGQLSVRNHQSTSP